MPSEMTLRVAKAMYVGIRTKNEGPFGQFQGAREAYLEDWDTKLSDDNRASYINAARSATSAMFDPSPQMIDAAVRYTGIDGEVFRKAWHAAITAPAE